MVIASDDHSRSDGPSEPFYAWQGRDGVGAAVDEGDFRPDLLEGNANRAGEKDVAQGAVDRGPTVEH